MKLRDQRTARNALRKLVRRMVRADPSEWEAKIAGAIAAEISIYHYIQAVGLKSAIAESGGDMDFIAALTASLKASEMVPADINYGEEQ